MNSDFWIGLFGFVALFGIPILIGWGLLKWYDKRREKEAKARQEEANRIWNTTKENVTFPPTPVPALERRRGTAAKIPLRRNSYVSPAPQAAPVATSSSGMGDMLIGGGIGYELGKSSSSSEINHDYHGGGGSFDGGGSSASWSDNSSNSGLFDSSSSSSSSSDDSSSFGSSDYSSSSDSGVSVSDSGGDDYS